MDYHEEHGHFPGISRQYPRRLAPLFNFLFWAVVVLYGLVTVAFWSFCWFVFTATLLGSSKFIFGYFFNSFNLMYPQVFMDSA